MEGWWRKRGAQAEVGAEAIEEEVKEVRAIEAGAWIEEAKRKKEGRDRKHQMKGAGADLLIRPEIMKHKGKTNLLIKLYIKHHFYRSYSKSPRGEEGGDSERE